ncbi:unnamed protein product [Phytophthora fragariaefolia]|uniref:Unnamed protein product n=1 Tax=Phytophthora fragariaefolia TaxID=1490495 RepID=A0A9W6YPW0_9STRA|nr:unnamed protein product [Phytophthora fragariaefolia]
MFPAPCKSDVGLLATSNHGVSLVYYPFSLPKRAQNTSSENPLENSNPSCLVYGCGKDHYSETAELNAELLSSQSKSDVEMHKEHIRKLFALMRKHKLYANLKKCIFGASEIPVLGCLVGKNGVRPDPGKVRVIHEWPTPSNIKDLRQFLGLATYLCKYVSNYAGKIRPLSQLLKKDAVWDWTAECQQALDAVKQGLSEAPN